MERFSRYMGVILIGILISTVAYAAKIKKQSGEIVEGEIQGTLAFRDDIKKSGKNSDVEYIVTYTLVSGKDITSINEEGFSRKGLVIIINVSQKNSLPDDADVIRASLQLPGGVSMGETSTGGSIFRIDGRSDSETVMTDTILGQIVTKAGAVDISNHIEVVTAKGNVVIPVTELVSVKAKANKTSSATKSGQAGLGQVHLQESGQPVALRSAWARFYKNQDALTLILSNHAGIPCNYDLLQGPIAGSDFVLAVDVFKKPKIALGQVDSAGLTFRYLGKEGRPLTDFEHPAQGQVTLTGLGKTIDGEFSLGVPGPFSGTFSAKRCPGK